MIRINLLGGERQKTRKSVSFLDPRYRTPIACALILGLSACGIGFWYWSLTRDAARLETEVAWAQQETARLTGVLAEVKRAEERRTELQRRVTVIEDLRRGQSVPVQLLDHVSHSVPDMLWLTALDQKADAVGIEGRTTTLISLADFVGNLGTNKLVAKPIDIVNSQVEASSTGTAAGSELIKFSVKVPIAQKPVTAPIAQKTAGAGAPGVPPAAH